MSKLGLQRQDKNIATLTASGTADGFQAEYGRLNFVKDDRKFTHDGWLSISLGEVSFLFVLFFFTIKLCINYDICGSIRSFV